MPKKYSKKQKVTRRRRLSWPLGIPIIIVVLAVLGIAGYGIHHHFEKKKATLTSVSSETKPTINYKPAPPADNNDNQERKVSSAPSPTLGSTTGTSQTTPGSYTVQIVSTNVSSSNVHVGTLVSGTSTGNCTLTGSQTGQSTLQLGTSTVRMDVNSYDCGVFNIPTSMFPTSGVWKLTLTVTSNGSSSSGSANVTI